MRSYTAETCLLLAESCEISSIRKVTAILRDAASAPIKSFNCGHYFKKKKSQQDRREKVLRVTTLIVTYSRGRFSNSRDKPDGTSREGVALMTPGAQNSKRRAGLGTDLGSVNECYSCV